MSVCKKIAVGFAMTMLSNVSLATVSLNHAWKLRAGTKEVALENIDSRWRDISVIDESNSNDIEYYKEFSLDEAQRKEPGQFIIVPPSWMPYQIFVNGQDISEIRANHSTPEKIYSYRIYRIPNALLGNENNVKILAKGEKILGGFRGSEVLVTSHKSYLIPAYLKNFFLNDVLIIFSILSFSISLTCFLIAKMESAHRRQYILLGLASITIIPHHLLSTSFYGWLFENPTAPFRFHLFFQAITWTSFALFYGLTSGSETVVRISQGRKMLGFVGTYILSVLAFSLYSPFGVFFTLISPLFAISAIIAPIWLYQYRHDLVVFCMGASGITLSVVSLISDVTTLNIYTHGYGAMLITLTGFYFFIKTFVRSAKRDRSAGELLKLMLPDPIHLTLDALIDAGAPVVQIREKLRGDSTLTNIFIDICSYGKMANTLPPRIVYETRSSVFQFINAIMIRNGVAFIKSIGDSAHFVGGLYQGEKTSNSLLAKHTLLAVMELLDGIDAMNIHLKEKDLPGVKLKISATIGVCEFGLEGPSSQLRYDVQGHWVNVTKRLEDAMDQRFYETYSQNVALVAAALITKCEDLTIRKRFRDLFAITDKNGIKYEAYVGRQYAEVIDHSDFMRAIYGQFSHGDVPETKPKNAANG